MDEIDFDFAFSESLVQAVPWAKRNLLATESDTWRSRTVEENIPLNAGNSIKRTRTRIKQEGRLCSKLSRVDVKPVQLREAFSEEIIEKTAKSIIKRVIDPKPSQINSNLQKIVSNDHDYNKVNEEDSDIEIEEIEVRKEIVEISSDTDSNDERPDTNYRPGQKVGSPITRQSIKKLPKEMPTRPERKRIPSRVVREDNSILNETATSSDLKQGGSIYIDSDDEHTDMESDSDEEYTDIESDSDDEFTDDAKRKPESGYISIAKAAVPTCGHGCFKIISPEIFKKIRSYYNSLYQNKQDAYLTSLLKPKPAKPGQCRKKETLIYILKHKNVRWGVCRKAFLHAFQITHYRLYDVWRKGVKKQEEQFVSMKEHLKSLPTVAPLSETSKQRLYFVPDLNLGKLHALYVEFTAQKNLPGRPVTKDYYKRVLERCSNVRLAPRKNGRCHLCETLNRNVQKFSALPNKPIHLMMAKTNLEKHEALAMEDQEVLGFVPKRQGIENALAVYIGKQQSHLIPRVPKNLNHYKRKLWAHYLGICDLKRQDATNVYVWDEVTAKRGSIEVISCLSKWIEDNHDREDNLILFTDDIGRYRNLNMLLFLLRLVHSKKFLKIEHYFLVQGHHANPCNLIYSDIDSALELQNAIASKEDLVGHIRDAVSKRGGDVILMERKDFLDYSMLQPHVYESSLYGMTFRNARVVSLHCCYKEGYYAAGEYSMVNMSSPIRLMPGLKSFTPKAFNLGAVELPLKYTNPIPLDPRKVKDLKDLLHCIVPYEKRDYLRMVLVDQESLEDEAESLEDETAVEDPSDEKMEEDDDLYDYV